MQRHRSRAALVALLLCALPFAAQAQTVGYLLPCSAASQLGRGCTLLGDPADPAVSLGHPAALAGMAGSVLSISGAAFLPTMEYTNAVNSGVAGEDNVYPIPAVFYSGLGSGPWRFGIGAQTLGGMGADYRLTHALLGANQRYHSKFGLMRGGVAAAFQASPAVAIGATVGALFGQLEFSTPYSVSPSQLAGMAGLAQDPDYLPLLSQFTEATAYAELTGLSGFAPSASVSLAIQATPRLGLALAYTAPATLTLGNGDAAMDMNTQFGLLYQALVQAKGGDAATVAAQLSGMGLDLGAGMATEYEAEVDFGVPQTLTLGIGFQASDRLGLGLDLGWIGYASAFDEMPLRMSNGTSTNINLLINGSPSDGSFETSWPLQWEDSWTVRAGAEYAAAPGVALRAGVIHGANPVASEGLFTIFPAVVETAGTVGASYTVGRTDLHFAYAHTFANEQTAATTHLVANEYAGSTSRLAEKMISVGASVRLR